MLLSETSASSEDRTEIPVPMLSLKTLSALMRPDFDLNTRVMMKGSGVVWRNAQVVVAAGTAAGDGLRAVTRSTVEHSGRCVHNMAVAGEAFARAESPADLLSAQQALLRSASTDMVLGIRTIGETMTQAVRAVTEHWTGFFAPAAATTPESNAA